MNKTIHPRCNSYNRTGSPPQNPVQFTAEYCNTRFSPIVLVATQTDMFTFPNYRISGWPDFVPGGISIWCGPSTMGLQSRGGSREPLEDQSIVQNISQIYPLWFRSTGVSISTGFNWSLNLIVTFTFPYLQQVGWKIC